MFIQVEPAGFFMHTVKLMFDLESPDNEDQQVRDYLSAHELEPKYRWHDQLDERQCEFMQFGGCYLGGHLEKIGQIQRHQVEVELLTAEVGKHLDAMPGGEAPATAEQRQEALNSLVQAFHEESAFQAGENGELVASLDEAQVQEAARSLLSQRAG